jgi:hypothetical protein
MKKITVAAALFAAFALPGLAAAQTTTPPAKDTAATPRVDQRQANQEKRIDKGVESGQLNQKETARLEKGQAHVDKIENKAKSDGVVTKEERQRLHHAQNVESKRIHSQKHDAQQAK